MIFSRELSVEKLLLIFLLIAIREVTICLKISELLYSKYKIVVIFSLIIFLTKGYSYKFIEKKINNIEVRIQITNQEQ